MQQNHGHLFVNGVVSIVSAHVGNNPISPDDVPVFMRSVSKALAECVVDATRVLSDPGSAAQSFLAAPQPERAALPAPAAAQERAATGVEALAPAVAPAAEAPAPVAEAPKAANDAAPKDAVAEEKPKRPRTIYHRFPNLPRKAAVNIGDSIQTDGVICLFDGEKRKMLSRHLLAKYSMTPEEYREYWKLPADYPMTAPGYAQEKRIVAVAQGLGTPKLYENTPGGAPVRAPAPAKAAPKRQRARQSA